LWQAIEQRPARRANRLDAARLLRLAQDLLADRFTQRPELIAKWHRGEIDDLAAARAFLNDESTR
jgi:hypothetical protein